ncbi:MAG: aldose 1-epimerase family protein [Clostridia bacterium]|nr:aldose 1-epimerase family protein [Clostridia bacterium]
MIILKNEFLTVKINEVGAEIKSIECNNTEYIWEGKPEIWGASCPLLFPICGGLKEDKYTLGGKEYTLQKHGFARKKTFKPEYYTDSSVCFLLYSDDDTKQSFPFDFELRVIYTLKGKSVKIDYSVKNKSGDTMYFNIGSHEGYYTPEGIEDYDIVFPQNETLDNTVLYGNLLSYGTLPILKDSSVLPLYDKYFIVDALVFTDIKSRSATLKNRKTGRAVKIDFPDDKYLLLWHKHGAPYICIEPWNGIPDRVGSSFDITEKEGITKLGAYGEFKHTHTVTIIE